MEKINVNLYGGKGIFGGRETPLEADTIYCDSYNSCQLYKEGKCLNCRAFRGIKCPKGRVETKHGYTHKALKYWSFRGMYEKDEVYNKLSYPGNRVAVIGDLVYLNLVYVGISKKTSEDSFRKTSYNYVIKPGYYGDTSVLIPKEELTIDFLIDILSKRPQALLGSLIEDYQEKIVPDIIQDLKKALPELYNELIQVKPEFNIQPNYVGKYAYMITLVDGSVLVDCHGNKAVKKGDYLYCEKYTKGFVPFDGEYAECTVKISPNKTYKVNDNNQCDDNTVFE